MKFKHAFLPLIMGLAFGSGSALALETDCDVLKEKVEHELLKQGDTSSTVEIVHAKDADRGIVKGTCAEGLRRVIVITQEPS